MSEEKVFEPIICDTCLETIIPIDPRQVRCVTGIKDVLSACQKKAKLKISADHKKPKAGKGNKKRVCLRCNNKFSSTGPFNRVCNKCRCINERVKKESKLGITSIGHKHDPSLTEFLNV